ncbi:MAG: hypothetical protein KA110_09425 [Acidimicrobiia bacterium]|nr:hypothetical protein [Acidimicrobiia bacterium]
MIRADRTAVPEPASLNRRFPSGTFKGKTEAEAVAAAFAEWLQTHPDGAGFSFKYQRYSEADVKSALELLFHGKCAYCESRYSGTQPVDVEHWRPKSEVHEQGPDGKVVVLPGYHWLASAWSNLFPSCIDCNRRRTQTDFVTGREGAAGKANQFPVKGPRMHPPVNAQPPATEDALLLNPCDDEPSEFLDFDDIGVAIARNGNDKAKESIRVYALNRSELVMDRLGVAGLIEQRLRTIESLAKVLTTKRLPKQARLDIEDLVSHEINALLEMTRPDRPFSALAKAIINRHAPL